MTFDWKVWKTTVRAPGYVPPSEGFIALLNTPKDLFKGKLELQLHLSLVSEALSRRTNEADNPDKARLLARRIECERLLLNWKNERADDDHVHIYGVLDLNLLTPHNGRNEKPTTEKPNTKLHVVNEHP